MHIPSLVAIAELMLLLTMVTAAVSAKPDTAAADGYLS